VYLKVKGNILGVDLATNSVAFAANRVYADLQELLDLFLEGETGDIGGSTVFGPIGARVAEGLKGIHPVINGGLQFKTQT